jgi:hypothetical protein
MNTNDTINRKFKSKITYIGLAVALAIPCGAAISGNPSGERRAQVLEFTFPIDAGLISCPEDNQLDGQEVSGFAIVRGIAKNSDFLTPWLDGSGGQHLQQIARITYDVEAGNGDHQGGVAMYFQEEYYSAQGDYPDLYWKLDFALVVDAKGNPRVYREEVSEAEFVCVSD